jgi:U32 family peptidase
LLHDDEYVKALDLALTAHQAKVDAVIIQDLGLWRTLTRELPDLKRHASTQMTIHHPSQVAVMAQLGAERVILARELRLSEVDACTREAERFGIETEHFVHGALCYAFSGQCLMSNFAGCRSANRGTCAQNCRFDYVRTENGRSSEKIDSEISMKDFALIGRVKELADIGVASLKIEGRLKGPDYVYTTSRVYRAATDAWLAGKPFDVAWAKELLKDVFARSHTDAPLMGDYSARSRLHRYEPEQDRAPDATLITIDRARGEAVLRSNAAITAGQGYSFSVGFFNGGFLVVAAKKQGDRYSCKIRIAEHGPRLPEQLPLFRNADHERKREAQQAMSQVPIQDVPQPSIALQVTCHAQVGRMIKIIIQSSDGRQVEINGVEPLVAASGRPLDEALMRDKFGAFGGTGFHLGTLALHSDGQAFVAAGHLKELRRQAVEALMALPVTQQKAPEQIVWTPPEPGNPKRINTQVWVCVSSRAAGEAALAAGASAVWFDDAACDWWDQKTKIPELPHDKRWFIRHSAVSPVSQAIINSGHGVVAGHVGMLAAAQQAGRAVIADVFLNTFSSETMLAYHALGAQAVVISLECSAREIARLAARAATLQVNGVSTPQLAVIAHGRLPAMLTRQEHGVAVGKSLSITAAPHDGGLPYTIQRRAGGDTVIWEGRHLCAAHELAPTAGLVDAWILELADQPPDIVTELTRAYVALAQRGDENAADDIIACAERYAPHGLFKGHLAQGSRELDAVIERMNGQAVESIADEA